MSEPEEAEPFNPEELQRFRLPERLRRIAWLVALLVVVLAISPFVSRYINHYRAVVLAVRDGEMLLGRKNRFPDWVPSIPTAPGTIVLKEVGDWNPRTVPPLEPDQQLLDLYRRYVRRYVGPIVELRPPVVRNGAYTAVVQTADGKKIDVPLWSEALSSARVGLWLRKDAETWEPVLIDAPQPAEPPKAPESAAPLAPAANAPTPVPATTPTATPVTAPATAPVIPPAAAPAPVQSR